MLAALTSTLQRPSQSLEELPSAARPPGRLASSLPITHAKMQGHASKIQSAVYVMIILQQLTGVEGHELILIALVLAPECTTTGGLLGIHGLGLAHTVGSIATLLCRYQGNQLRQQNRTG